jgi:hypothetical protein
MSKKITARKATLFLIMFSFASAWAIEARAGATISDRRYWPNEARSSPGQVIEIYPPWHAYAGPGFPPRPAVEPLVTTRGKARRPR